MAEFRQHLCWSPWTASETISTEAVSPSPSVFFATHAPLRIRRRHPQARAEGVDSAVTEEEVRRDFLERPTVNGALLMPVTGQSGAGKSHLIRWVHELTPSTDQRRVIHLPKTSTSLRAVVRTLLDQPGVDSPKLAQLRADVERMSSEMDPDSLQRRLINELSEAVAVAEPKPGTARVLAGPDRLAALLLDPHVRDHMLQKSKLIPRLAANLLTDRREGDDERPTSFTLDDLPLHIADVRKASAKAQQLLGQLTNRAELQTAAVDILTEQLPAAVTAAWNIGGGRLQQAMLEIRREYARRSIEIVLLVEDFAVLQGVQRDLLDALIEVGVRDGKTMLAPVRTLMAVTTGYFERLAETVLTRARAATPYMYDIHAPFETDERGQAYVTAFVGRYLNAARLGRDALDQANISGGGTVPNACDACLHRVTCHATFGSSKEGHGLYPFNWPALRRAIRARPAHDSPASFNPRAVIGEVVRPVLVEHAHALSDGTFPDTRFREDFPTAAGESYLLGPVRHEIDERDPDSAARRSTFLEFWGDAPDHLTNLTPGLHTAFGISPLHLDESPPVRVQPRPPAGPSPVQPVDRPARDPAIPDTVPAQVLKMIRDIEDWQGRGSQLSQNTAAQLRRIIRHAVINRCLWNDPVMAEPLSKDLDKAWPVKSIVVSITGAEAENLPGTADAPIRFNRNPGNATFFRQLLLANAGVVAGNAAAIRRLHQIADRFQPHLQLAVQRTRGFGDEDLVVGMRASLLGAALAGRAWPGMDEAALLDVVFDDGSSWERADAATRTPLWTRAWETHRAARAELVARLRDSVGFGRGTRGDVRIIDATRALALLRKAARTWSWQRPERLADWVGGVSGFSGFVELARNQVAVLANYLGEIRTTLPTGVGGVETVAAVEQALNATIGEGLAPDNLAEFRAAVADVKGRDWRCVERLERDLARIDAARDDAEREHALIVAAAIDRSGDLFTIRTFLASSDAWLTEKLAKATMRGGGSGAAAAIKVQELLRQWADVTGGEQ